MKIFDDAVKHNPSRKRMRVVAYQRMNGIPHAFYSDGSFKRVDKIPARGRPPTKAGRAKRIARAKRIRAINPSPIRLPRVESSSAGLALARKAFTAASRTTDRRLLQARISYAQGVMDTLHAVRMAGIPQVRVYLDGLRALLR
ncbi:MAG: hypothetical protein ACREUY_10700 [Burkholderiales bacterium]